MRNGSNNERNFAKLYIDRERKENQLPHENCMFFICKDEFPLPKDAFRQVRLKFVLEKKNLKFYQFIFAISFSSPHVKWSGPSFKPI